MTRLRIRCKSEGMVDLREGGLGAFCGVLPGLHDAEMAIVAADGTETPVTNVAAVRIEMLQNHPARATVEFIGVELDVEAVLDTAPKP